MRIYQGGIGYVAFVGLGTSKSLRFPMYISSILKLMRNAWLLSTACLNRASMALGTMPGVSSSPSQDILNQEQHKVRGHGCRLNTLTHVGLLCLQHSVCPLAVSFTSETPKYAMSEVLAGSHHCESFSCARLPICKNAGVVTIKD